MQSLWRATCLAAVVVCFVGCGGEPTGVTVKGTIKVDGNPVESGSITFSPSSGKGQVAEGEIINGAYTALPFPGAHNVSFRIRKKVKEVLSIPSDPTSSKTVVYDPIKLTPETETMPFEVPAAGGEFSTDLKSKK